MKKLIAGILLLIPLARAAAAKQPSHNELIPLDAKKCRPATADEKKRLDPSWQEFEKYEITCPFDGPSRSPLLYVMSIDGEKWSESLPRHAIVHELPEAILLAPDGSKLGTLPMAFPFDPPVDLDVTFTDWVQGWPQTIQLYREDPAVSGNKNLPPLKWNIPKHSYAEQKQEVVMANAQNVKLNQAIKALNQSTSVDSERIGYAGHKSENYRRYEQVLQLASVQDLEGLLQHRNPIVRAYAAQGILQKDSKQAALVYPLLSDQAKVETIQGCTVGSSTIGTLTAYIVADLGDPGIVQTMVDRAKLDSRVPKEVYETLNTAFTRRKNPPSDVRPL